MNASNATEPINRFLQHNGTDPSAALKAGLEITGACVIGIALILSLYYFALRIMVVCFKPVPEHADD